MTRTVEIRALRLRPGAWPEFRRHYVHAALPLLEAAGFDVVAFGRSDAEPETAWVIRSYADALERRAREDAYYGSPAWRDGPRAAILACIDTYADAVLELDETTVEGLRGLGIDREDGPRTGASGERRLVEVRIHALPAGAWPAFERRFHDEVLPLLDVAGIDTLDFGRGPLDPGEPDGAYLIRSFASVADREAREAAFSASDAWRGGPREAILAGIETYVDAVLDLGVPTVEGLRRLSRSAAGAR
jgi:hypothetical protein